SLQRFAGKALSVSLAIPACKQYVREVFKSTSAVAKNSKISVPIQGPLRQELREWTFFGQLVWSLTLAVGTSSLCHNVQRRLPDGLESSLGKRWSRPANTRLLDQP
ncbi:unnamed protein product, partial [Porites evermanni]